jgi:hypothetical protein
VNRSANRLVYQEFIKNARRYRTIEIHAGRQTITAADPSPTTYAKPSTSSTIPTDLRTHMKRPVKLLLLLCLVCAGLPGLARRVRGRAGLAPWP